MSTDSPISNRTTDALLARRALAEKATPGPWEKGSALRRSYGVNAILDCNGGLIADTEFSVSQYEDGDAAHIAANSPDVVMADIEELLRLRAEVERLEKEADWLAERHAERCRRSAKPCMTYVMPDCECEYDYGCCISPQKWRKVARKAAEEENHGRLL